MEITGNIRKMESTPGHVIQYYLPLGETRVDMNRLIGKEISMRYEEKIHCIRCGRETSRSFAQGYCYPCFISAPETEECVLRPELCRAHEGISRDMAYAREHCLIEHVVYLSLTSGLKVGVTRNTQIPVRWIDQGAIRAIELARTPNRYNAGLIEIALKAHMDDRTNWRIMLSGPAHAGFDMFAEKLRVIENLPEDLKKYVTDDEAVMELNYPVSRYPEKIKSSGFDKEMLVSGVLSGIKGQYLIFEDNRVINMRKFGGYLITLTTPITS